MGIRLWSVECLSYFGQYTDCVQLTTWTYDGGADVHGAFTLSGELMADQLKDAYGDSARDQVSASDVAATNIAKREFQKEYMEYWNSTKELTGTGRPVDAFIAPLAPFPAARPKSYKYYGYSTIINLLDYTSCVIPVTTADRRIDVIGKEFKPLSDLDKSTSELCMYKLSMQFFRYRLTTLLDDSAIYDGAHVAIQLVGRRLEEEKVLALAEYIGETIAGPSRGTTVSEKL